MASEIKPGHLVVAVEDVPMPHVRWNQITTYTIPTGSRGLVDLQKSHFRGSWWVHFDGKPPQWVRSDYIRAIPGQS